MDFHCQPIPLNRKDNLPGDTFWSTSVYFALLDEVPADCQRRCELLSVALTYLLAEFTDSCGNNLAMNFLTFLFDAALPIIPVAGVNFQFRSYVAE